MSARPDIAEKFLHFAFPDGPWKLAAIPADGRRGMRVKTFTPGAEPAMRRWAEDFNNDGWGIYFEINPADRKTDNKKAKGEDITAVRALAVDIDCGPGSVEAVTRKLIEGAAPKMPKPSLLIWSGGGVWPVWLLRPFVTDFEWAATINENLAAALKYLPQDDGEKGADACHNIDRLARLPGFVNWPDEGKKAKGRVPVNATWGPL